MNDCSAIANKAETFNYKVVRQFAIMTVVWGIVGMAVGVFLAAQLIWPQLNFDTAWLTYGRLRPLHTNAVIFAFGGSALFATSYLSFSAPVRRACSATSWRRSLSGAGKSLSWLPQLPCLWVSPAARNMRNSNGRSIS